SCVAGSAFTACLRLLPRNRPVAPRHVPDERSVEPLRHEVDAMGAARPAAGEAEQAHEAPGPQAMAGDGLIGIFRAGGEMAARIADEAGKGELVEPHQPGAEKASGRLRPGAGPVARAA